MRPFKLSTLMRAIKVAEARFLEGRVGGMNADTTYKSQYVEQMQRDVRGILAEMVVGNLFDPHYFPSVNTFHKVPDVGSDVEVRSTEYENGALLVRNNDSPDRKFVLVHVELNDGRGEPRVGFNIKGWVWGHEAMTDEWWREPEAKEGERKPRPAWWYRGPLRSIDSLQC